jgi:hypothetical protein
MLTSCSADFDPEDEGDMFFQNVGSNMDYYIPEDGNIQICDDFIPIHINIS